MEMDSGQVLTFKTTPVNVAILMAFQEKGRFMYHCIVFVKEFETLDIIIQTILFADYN